MTYTQIIILSLSFSFCITQVWRPINIKPFNCMMCFTGWAAAGLGLYQFGISGLALFFVGCFAGALFDAIKMRWL